MAQTKTASKKRTAKKASSSKATKKKAPASKAPAKRTAKKTTSKSKATKKNESKTPVGDQEVTIDRRRDDQGPEAQQEGNDKNATLERREKVNRRRQIDPTTCEREYNEAEVEFMNALDDYKRKSGRMFPTCSEVLEVILGLGYVKLSPAEMALVRPEPEPTEDEDIEAVQAASEAEEAFELSAEVRED